MLPLSVNWAVRARSLLPHRQTLGTSQSQKHSQIETSSPSGERNAGCWRQLQTFRCCLLFHALLRSPQMHENGSRSPIPEFNPILCSILNLHSIKRSTSCRRSTRGVRRRQRRHLFPLLLFPFRPRVEERLALVPIRRIPRERFVLGEDDELVRVRDVALHQALLFGSSERESSSGGRGRPKTVGQSSGIVDRGACKCVLTLKIMFAKRHSVSSASMHEVPIDDVEK